MHELACPGCNGPTQYDLRDYLLMCPFCSVTFSLSMETGRKDIFTDHYIIPNSCDSRQIKTLITEWIRRLHHKPDAVDREYYVTEINGFSIPFWIVSLEAHTQWKGLVKRQRGPFDHYPGSHYITETGQFRRNYRWAISARQNLCENWGMAKLHEPKEALIVDWDGFPLDSTFSRGQIDPKLGATKNNEELSAYEVREFFEFKYANGLPIIQVSEEEALRRAKSHIDKYHYALAKLHTTIPIDIRTELEIAGIQLIHLPFWHARYVYQPRSILKHLHRSTEKNVIVEGYTGGILKGELALVQRDKLWVNSYVTGGAALILFLLGLLVHPAFIFVALFMLMVAFFSAHIAANRGRNAAKAGAAKLEPGMAGSKVGALD